MIDVTADEVIPGISFHPTPGHTVDHASIILENGEPKALFAGNVLYHPIQVIEPELISLFDPDRDQSLQSRIWAFNYAADQDTIWFSSHFPASSAGRVSHIAGGYSWSFA
jgi:glyoxylase-like metal-dependent hydrolase (beta-lactamase superfamily II)